jgi:hypothetical protein
MSFETDLSASVLLALVDAVSPDLLVIGPDEERSEAFLTAVVRELRQAHPNLPIVLGGPAVGGGLPHERDGVVVLERIDATVGAVEHALASAASPASV